MTSDTDFATDIDVALRRARLDDSYCLFGWRNGVVTRSMSRNAQPISWETHRSWYAAKLEDPDTLILVGLYEGEPAGLVRFNRQRQGVAEVSINVAPDLRGRGVGMSLLSRGCRFAEEARFTMAFFADIALKNIASQRIFSRAGFKRVGFVGGLLRYERGEAAKSGASGGGPASRPRPSSGAP